MHGRTAAGAAVGFDFVGLGGSHQLADVFDASARVNHQEQRLAAGQKHRREVVQHIVLHAGTRFEHQGGSRNGVGGEQQGVTVSRSLGNEGVANGAAGTRFVLYHHRLAKFKRQFFGKHTGQCVGVATGRVRHHNRHRLAGIGLGVGRAPSQRQQRDTASQQATGELGKNISAKVFHLALR